MQLADIWIAAYIFMEIFYLITSRFCLGVQERYAVSCIQDFLGGKKS